MLASLFLDFPLLPERIGCADLRGSLVAQESGTSFGIFGVISWDDLPTQFGSSSYCFLKKFDSIWLS